MDTAKRRVYFFWDYEMDDDEVRRMLRRGSAEERAWVISRILEHAKWDDIWRYLCVDDIRENPGISIKLSALHPRYEEPQRSRVMSELVPTVLSLAQQAKAAGMGLNIDAEEADRLELSLELFRRVALAVAFVQTVE
mgnify:CR=1 FL=1